MSLFQLLLLSLALSADAFAVSVCRAKGRRSAFVLASAFGFFQAVMPVMGWHAGSALRTVLSRVAPLAAFLILFLVGGRMLWNAVRDRKNKTCETTDKALVLSLAFATSLDAFAAGISISLIGSGIWLPAAVIGSVTFAVCLVGAGIGSMAGARLGWHLEAVAGLVIMALGVKALV
ncbi:MAG: manganese efflux pump MntP family protein [Candidatus Fermentibacteraceae bacterium]